MLHCRVVARYTPIHPDYFPLLLIYLAAEKNRERETVQGGKSIIQSQREEKD